MRFTQLLLNRLTVDVPLTTPSMTVWSNRSAARASGSVRPCASQTWDYKVIKDVSFDLEALRAYLYDKDSSGAWLEREIVEVKGE